MDPKLIVGGVLLGGVAYLVWRRRGAPGVDGEGPVTLSTPRGPSADPWLPEAGQIGAQIGASAGLGRISDAAVRNTTIAAPPSRPGYLVDRGHWGRGFGMRTTSTGARRPHSAIDITARLGQPIHVVLDGVVEHAGWINGYGNCVLVRHGGDVTTFYAHASRLLVAAGQAVQRGQTIAEVGNTGFERMGWHLHTSVHRGLPVGARMTTDVEARYGIDPGPFWASNATAMVREIGE